MTQPADQTTEDREGIQEQRREEAERRNPDLHGAALEALEGNPDGTSRSPDA